MKRKTCIKQHDITDCGAACIASISAHYGLNVSIARIRQYACTDKRGTNALGMVEAAAKLGFMAKAVKGGGESLAKIPLPSVAHVVVKEKLQHFLVIYKVTKSHITVMDPGEGKLSEIPNEEFRNMWTGVLILIVPNESFRKGSMEQSGLRQFITLIRPHKTIMFQALFGAMIFSIIGLSTSFYVEKIIDYVIPDGNQNLLHLMSIVMIALLLLRVYIGAMKSILALKTGQKMDTALILGYYKHLLTLPQTFFDTMRVGEIISRVNDAVKIRYFINNVSLDLAVNLMILLFTTGLMFVYSWKLALIALICIPLFTMLYLVANKINKRLSRSIMESSADLEAQLVESLNAIGTVKRFGLETYANTNTENRFARLLKNTYTLGKAGININASALLVSGGIIIAVLWAGTSMVLKQDISAGTLMSFYALVGYILTPVSSLISANQTIQDALIAADRLFQIMDLEQEESTEGKVALIADMIGNISFQHVSFRYGTRTQVFTDFNLEISKGKTTAIIGESGSGKTTLMSLLQNIYPIQQGRISIGNYDIRFIRNDTLRKLIATVPQQVELFSGDIIENIALGDTEPDIKHIMDICTMLNIKDFIEKLPQAYQTQIGEHGLSLSGGERQRIAIARALYKKPEILILDEATSSLDSNSEQHVKNTLRQFVLNGKTVIVIAHRLSTIKDADHIIVLQQGIVTEQGTHNDLYTLHGEYHRLWQFTIPDTE
jgi:ATP-binding cassette, subfamily C, bacteriocin exporter